MKNMRKKVLVELLHDHGPSISYNRVLEISAQLGDASVRGYQEEEHIQIRDHNVI